MSQEKPKAGMGDVVSHIKESCADDPFYLTKIIVSAIGKNTIDIVVRIAIYVLVVYPALTTLLHVPNGVAALLVLVGIIVYHSSIAVYHRLAKEASNNGHG